MPADSKKDSAADLAAAVREAYSAAALDPHGRHPFPVGREFAEALGYPAGVLDVLPASAEAFSGVSNVSIFAGIPAGSRVLDLGCGAGLDTLIAARRLDGKGLVAGVDFSRAMLERARRAAADASIPGVSFLRANAHELPLRDSSIDVALANGVFNLSPLRGAIFAELARVVRLGGAVYAAELILCGPLPPEVRESTADWFA